MFGHSSKILITVVITSSPFHWSPSLIVAGGNLVTIPLWMMFWFLVNVPSLISDPYQFFIIFLFTSKMPQVFPNYIWRRILSEANGPGGNS
jgi:hypothetical protein